MNHLDANGPNTVIGPYKLLDQIGDGVFAVVFTAEQTKPVSRKVALKMLKPGTATPLVVARFEAERQALAIMDHPNTEPAKLTRLVRGELDWIVMKCLEKDPARRYETVDALARGIEHCLIEG